VTAGAESTQRLLPVSEKLRCVTQEVASKRKHRAPVYTLHRPSASIDRPFTWHSDHQCFESLLPGQRLNDSVPCSTYLCFRQFTARRTLPRSYNESSTSAPASVTVLISAYSCQRIYALVYTDQIPFFCRNKFLRLLVRCQLNTDAGKLGRII
jgi:hypothetical protein